MRQKPNVRDSIEVADLDVLEAKQLELLNENVERAKANSEFYRDRIDVDRLDSLDDVRELPLLTKETLRSASNRPTVVCGPEAVAEYHTSSGTTGQPFVMTLTDRDLQRTREVLGRTWWMHGVREGDTVQNMAAYGPFTAGQLNQYALQHVGAGVFPAGVNSTTRQIEYANRIDPDYLVAVSSYYIRLIEVLEENGLDFPDLDGVVGGGVPVTDSVREFVSDRLDAPFYNQYGLAEINTGIAGECRCHDGLHVQADYAYPEIVDPDTYEPLGEGEEGLLTLTTLQRDGQILLRYVTNDITSITYDPCDCGRTLPRIAPIRGRADDVIFVRGTKLDTSYLQSFVESLDDLVHPFNWQLRIDHESGRDELTLYVKWLTDRTHPETVREEFTDRTGLTLDAVEDIRSLDEDYLEHKLEHVVDERS